MVNFYRQFLPNCADTILPLTSLLAGSKRTFKIAPPAAFTSFEQEKALLADSTLLIHFHADAPISPMLNASNVAVGVVLQRSLPDSIVSPRIDLAEMAAEQRRVGSPCDEDVSRLQLQELPLTTGNGIILCDVSAPSHRPFVPPSIRRKVFSSLHNLSHPGSRATDKLVSDRFVWPGMHKDLASWTQTSFVFQRSKVQRRNKAPIGTFPDPGERFSHVHLDIAGPLTLSYLLTCMDRFTR
ncbi:hypothetical protein SprV_0902720600 [Sparganum proliferum]